MLIPIQAYSECRGPVPRRGPGREEVMGSLFRPKYTGTDGSIKESAVWWAKYYANGRPVRESTGTDKEKEARRFLKEREGRVATGQPVLPRAEKVRYQAIRDDLRRFYSATGGRELVEVDKRLAHLDRFFSTWRAVSIDRSAIVKYIEFRQTQKASNG